MEFFLLASIPGLILCLIICGVYLDYKKNKALFLKDVSNSLIDFSIFIFFLLSLNLLYAIINQFIASYKIAYLMFLAIGVLSYALCRKLFETKTISKIYLTALWTTNLILVIYITREVLL